MTPAGSRLQNPVNFLLNVVAARTRSTTYHLVGEMHTRTKRMCHFPHVETVKAPDISSSWLYKIHLAEDANFKQKARARPNDNRDKALFPGGAAFVDNDKFSNHLRTSMPLDDSEVRLFHFIINIFYNQMRRSTTVLALPRSIMPTRNVRRVCGQRGSGVSFVLATNASFRTELVTYIVEKGMYISMISVCSTV
jgi:hypothetical protein